jgi:hypothetical protein
VTPPRRWERDRVVKTGVLGAMLALFGLALFIFVLPFAFPTPPPIITRFQSTVVFSPNDDGRRDVARINLRVYEPSDVDLEIVSDGETVATLLADEPLPPGWRSVAWDGRDDAGNVLPDGEYSIRLRARSGDKRFNTSRSITIDTTAPVAGVFRVESATLAAPGAGECRVTVTARDGGSVLLEALRPGGVEPVAHRGPRPAPAGRPVRWAWRGVGNGGDPVAPGLYVVRATLGDASGNRTVRERTCWVGRMAGTITPPDPLPRTILGVSLRDTRGAPVPGDTPITLQFRRRTGVPGRTATPPLGDPVGAPVATTAASARITTPAGIRPDALWLVASSGDGSAIALIAPGAAP